MLWRDGRMAVDFDACYRIAVGAAKPTTRAKPRPKRGERLDVQKKLRDYLIQHIRDQMRLERDSRARGFDWKYTPPPSQDFIAGELGVTPTRLSRAINTDPDPALKVLWEAARTEECLALNLAVYAGGK
jgi:hypothetical protein